MGNILAGRNRGEAFYQLFLVPVLLGSLMLISTPISEQRITIETHTDRVQACWEDLNMAAATLRFCQLQQSTLFRGRNIRIRSVQTESFFFPKAF